MSDVHSKEIRSYNMSRIRSKNTKPEIMVRKILFSFGLRFRTHNQTLPGKPDVVLQKYHTVVFIHGCFWHGHKNCKYYVIPKTRTEWWVHKIDMNKRNDKLAKMKLKNAGWNVIEVFECALRKDKLDTTINKIVRNIKNQIL